MAYEPPKNTVEVAQLFDPRFAAVEPPAADLPRATLHQPARPRMPAIALGALIAVVILALVLLSAR